MWCLIELGEKEMARKRQKSAFSRYFIAENLAIITS